MDGVDAWDMPSLRAKLKKAKPGTGEVRRAIESCTFDIGERGFTMLIATFGKSGPWKKALEVFETMSGPVMAARGIRPNAYSYSAIISVCCGAKASSKALGLYNEMKAFNPSATLKPSALIYGCLIPECSRASCFHTVVELYQEMQAFGFQGSDATLLCVLEAMLVLKKWLMAADVLDMLQLRGFVVPQKSYKDLYRACAETG